MTNSVQDESTKQGTSAILTVSFWVELIVKTGVPAALCVYLVYMIASEQQRAIKDLQSSIITLTQKIDKLSDRIERK